MPDERKRLEGNSPGLDLVSPDGRFSIEIRNGELYMVDQENNNLAGHYDKSTGEWSWAGGLSGGLSLERYDIRENGSVLEFYDGDSEELIMTYDPSSGWNYHGNSINNQLTLNKQQIIHRATAITDELYGNDFGVGWYGNTLTIPTYDGSNEATSPSVRYFEEQWNGHHFWMAMTPYPSGNDNYENPSIVVSNDGDTWEVPSGLTNPIVPEPTVETDEDNHYNSDVSLLYYAGILYMYYREVIEYSDGDNQEIIKIISSKDGINWNNPTIVLDGGKGGGKADRMSPTAIWNKSEEKFYLYTVNATSDTVEYRTSDTIDSDFSSPSTVTLTTQPSDDRVPWSIDAIRIGNKVILTMSTYDTVATSFPAIYLYFSENDFATFDTETAILTSASADSSIADRVYDSCVVPTQFGGEISFMGYFSGSNTSGNWAIRQRSIYPEKLSMSGNRPLFDLYRPEDDCHWRLEVDTNDNIKISKVGSAAFFTINMTTNTFQFENESGNLIAELDFSGNLSITGTVSENATL